MNWAITDKGYSQRRACSLVGLDWKTYRYASTRPAEEAVRKRLRVLASPRRRFGYRRLHILLRREGIEVNHKKLYRLYREKRLTARKRGGRKRALGQEGGRTVVADRVEEGAARVLDELTTHGAEAAKGRGAVCHRFPTL